MYKKIEDEREVLLVDMDNTLNKFWIRFEEVYNNNVLPLDEIKIKKEDLKVYEILKNIIPNESEDVRFHRRDVIFKTRLFWELIPIYEDAKEVMEKLYEKYNTYIITSPWAAATKCCEEKLSWVSRELPFIPLEKVIFTRDKWLVRCDYIIDDAPFYLQRDDCKTIAMHYEYNKDTPVSFRADSWKDIENYLIDNLVT